MLTDSGKLMILKLLTGEGEKIDSLKVGTSTTAEAPTDADLLGSIGVSKKIDSFSRGVNEVVFECVFDYNEGNGDIGEIGLFSADGTLLCRKTIIVKAKSSTQTMKVRYRVTIKRAGE